MADVYLLQRALSYNVLTVGQRFEPVCFFDREGPFMCVDLRSGQKTPVMGIPIESSLAGSGLRKTHSYVRSISSHMCSYEPDIVMVGPAPAFTRHISQWEGRPPADSGQG